MFSDAVVATAILDRLLHHSHASAPPMSRARWRRTANHSGPRTTTSRSTRRPAPSASTHNSDGRYRCPLWVISRYNGRSRHVRFTPDSGHSSVQVGCPLGAINRPQGLPAMSAVHLPRHKGKRMSSALKVSGIERFLAINNKSRQEAAISTPKATRYAAQSVLNPHSQSLNPRILQPLCTVHVTQYVASLIASRHCCFPQRATTGATL